MRDRLLTLVTLAACGNGDGRDPADIPADLSTGNDVRVCIDGR